MVNQGGAISPFDNLQPSSANLDDGFVMKKITLIKSDQSEFTVVPFYSGIESDYDQGIHGDGVYQCTDTKNTIVLGVKNTSFDESLQGSEIVIFDNGELSTTIGIGGYIDLPDMTLFNKLRQCIIDETPAYFKHVMSNNLWPLALRQEDNAIIHVTAVLTSQEYGTDDAIPENGSNPQITFYNWQIQQTGVTSRLYFAKKELTFNTNGDGTKVLTDNGTYMDFVSMQNITVAKIGDPIYFDPATPKEELEGMTFQDLTTQYVLDHIKDHMLILNNNDVEGTLGGDVSRFTVCLLTDTNDGSQVFLGYVFRDNNGNVYYRRVSISKLNSDTFSVKFVDDALLNAKTVDMTGYKKVELVDSLPSSPDEDTMYLIQESSSSGGAEEGEEGTFG